MYEDIKERLNTIEFEGWADDDHSRYLIEALRRVMDAHEHTATTSIGGHLKVTHLEEENRRLTKEHEFISTKFNEAMGRLRNGKA